MKSKIGHKHITLSNKAIILNKCDERQIIGINGIKKPLIRLKGA
jgi:hypothetical protein